MRAMKDSGIEWIGQIPENWSVEALKRNVKIEMGQSPASECYNSDGVGFPFLQGNADFTDKFPVERMYTSAANKFSKTGDLLLSVRAPVGAVNIADKEYAIGRGLCAITGGRISIPFLWYAIAVLNHEFDANSTGSTFESINTEDVGNAKIMVPGEDEQRRIAEYLDVKCAEIDALIAAKEKTNALLKERRQSIIYEAVTKGLNPDAPMKDSGVEWIGQIPEHWTKWRMKHLASEPLQYGANATGVEFREDIPRYVRITDITADRKLSDEGKQSLEMDIAQDYMLKDGDILFARSGATSGKSFYYEDMYGPCCFAGYLIKLRPDNHKVLSKFLYYYTLTQAYENWTQQIFIQATIQNISADKYNNLWFAIPKMLEEQKKIVAYLDERCFEMDKLISANESTIQKLKEYRQSIIYEAVTGKIEV